MPSIRAMDISASALTAERTRMEVIAGNMANASSTRSERGGPYRRLLTIMAASLDQQNTSAGSEPQFTGAGVKVIGVVEDQSALPLRYDPSHPDAGPDGYVRMPNVNPAVEMVDLITAVRAYEANVAVLNATKSLAMKALEIGRV